MKKNKYTLYIVIIYIIIIIILFTCQSCKVYYQGINYNTCPSNDKTFFYKRMGVKPNKSYLKHIN